MPSQAYTMGCSQRPGNCSGNELPPRVVVVSVPFYIAETETTVQQFQRFAEAVRYRTAAEEIGAGATRVEHLEWSSTGDRASNTDPAPNLWTPS